MLRQLLLICAIGGLPLVSAAADDAAKVDVPPGSTAMKSFGRARIARRQLAPLWNAHWSPTLRIKRKARCGSCRTQLHLVAPGPGLGRAARAAGQADVVR